MKNLESRACFGTTEYSKKSAICKKCHEYEECGKIQNRVKKVVRVFKDYKLYGRLKK